MLGIFLMVFVLSSIVSVLIKILLPTKINFTEMAATFLISIIFGGLMLIGFSWASTSDFNILNGKVVSKDRERVSCEHSYSCNCHTVGSGNTTSTQCDTCYEHSYDVDWNVRTTVGIFQIDRVNRQGTIQPDRWTKVNIGEPASSRERITNYVLASSDSLFNKKAFQTDGIKYGKMLPAYQDDTYDYYKYDHVLNVGVTGLDMIKYNAGIAEMLRDVGPSKQVNVLMVFAPTSDQEYKNALERHWIGGKKNDVVIVVGVTNYPKIDFVDAFSFGKSSGNELLMVDLRNNIQEIGDVSRVGDIVNIVGADVSKEFKRESMKKFSYLKADYFPSMTQLIFGGICYMILLIALTILFYRIDFDLSYMFNRKSKLTNYRSFK